MNAYHTKRSHLLIGDRLVLDSMRNIKENRIRPYTTSLFLDFRYWGTTSGPPRPYSSTTSFCSDGLNNAQLMCPFSDCTSSLMLSALRFCHNEPVNKWNCEIQIKEHKTSMLIPSTSTDSLSDSDIEWEVFEVFDSAMTRLYRCHVIYWCFVCAILTNWNLLNSLWQHVRYNTYFQPRWI